MRRPRFWRSGPDRARGSERGSEDVVFLEGRRAPSVLDGEGAAVFERERLDHRDRLLGQSPVSEERGEDGLLNCQSCPWVKVIELARQLLPGHLCLRDR